MLHRHGYVISEWDRFCHLEYERLSAEDVSEEVCKSLLSTGLLLQGQWEDYADQAAGGQRSAFLDFANEPSPALFSTD